MPEPDFALRAFRDDILPRLGDPELALVDVRSPAEYAGEVIAPPGMTETAQRGGHIPGAARSPRHGCGRPSPDGRRAATTGRAATAARPYHRVDDR